MWSIKENSTSKILTGAILIALFFLFVQKRLSIANIPVSKNKNIYRIKPKRKYKKTTTKFSSIFKSVKVLKLKNFKNNMLGEVGKIIYRNDTLLIMDDSYSKLLLAYDMNGNPLIKYGRLGRGPNEYRYLGDFFIDKNKIFILAKYGKINEYNIKTGEYIRTISFDPPSAYNFQSSKNHFYADSKLDLSDKRFNKFACRVLDNDGKLKNTFLNPIATNKGYSGLLTGAECQSRVLKYKENVYYVNSFADTIYKVNTNKIQPYAIFDNKNYVKYNDFKLSKDFLGLPFPQFKNKSEYSIYVYNECETYIYFCWKSNEHRFHLLYDKESNTTKFSGSNYNPDLLLKNSDDNLINPKFHYMDENIAISTNCFRNKKNIEDLQFVSESNKKAFQSEEVKIFIYKFKNNL